MQHRRIARSLRFPGPLSTLARPEMWALKSVESWMVITAMFGVMMAAVVLALAALAKRLRPQPSRSPHLHRLPLPNHEPLHQHPQFRLKLTG